MARTFNRAPYSVPTPSNSDIKSYFFNQSNFKGLNTNKNFLTVDQETFSSCENVYIDAQGLLRSRPCLKVDEKVLASSAVDAWEFGEKLQIYKGMPINDTTSQYFIIYNGISEGTFYLPTASKFIYVENRLFIFTEDSIQYYDDVQHRLFDATDYIYIPVTKVVSGNTIEQLDSPNVLTTSQITRYIFNNISNNYDLLVGKKVRINIDGNEFELVFKPNNQIVFVKDIRSISDLYISKDTSNLGEPMISVSEKDSVLLTKYENNKFETYYSVDKIMYVRLPDLPEGTLHYPVISTDGTVAACFTSKRIYVYSLVSVDEEGTMLFPEWTDLAKYLYGTSTSKVDGYTFTKASVLKLDTYDNLVALAFTGADLQYLHCYMITEGTESEISLPEYSERYKYNLNFTIYGSRMTVICYTSEELYTFKNGDSEPEYIAYSNFDYLPIEPWKLDLHITMEGYTLSYINRNDKEQFYIYNYNFEESSARHYSSKLTSVSQSVKYSNGILLTCEVLYLFDPFNLALIDAIPLLFESTPINVNDNSIFVIADNKLYSSSTDLTWYADEIIEGSVVPFIPDYVSELSDYYLSKGDTLYISKYPSEGDFKWYLPEINKQKMDFEITNLHPISATEMAVFTSNNIYYIQNSENVYLYYKSKLPVGCKKGADIITTYDGAHTIFATERGMAVMTYQNFVASTEQSVTYISDVIYDTFKEFNTEAIKLFMYDYWILCYKSNCNKALLLDTRNNSWWPLSYSVNLKTLKKMSDGVKILANKIYNSVVDDNEYYDYDKFTKFKINWHIQSQKLHLSAINYCKHISNITLTSVLDTDNPMYLNLTVANYRKVADISKVQKFSFSVDAIRTYVKKLNYSKVNEFQYLLTNEEYNLRDVPLSLSNITIKYKISKEVT